MSTDTHGAIINFGDGSGAFIDGIPDKCEHVWNGEEMFVVGRPGNSFFEEIWSETKMLVKGYDLSDAFYQKKFEDDGYSIRGGMSSCSKCKKPYQPDFFMF
jgi:hypothetical protein